MGFYIIFDIMTILTHYNSDSQLYMSPTPTLRLPIAGAKAAALCDIWLPEADCPQDDCGRFG